MQTHEEDEGSPPTSKSVEEPELELGQLIRQVVVFTEEAGQIVGSLGADVVEVEGMTNAMNNGVDKSGVGDDLTRGTYDRTENGYQWHGNTGSNRQPREQNAAVRCSEKEK